MRLTELDSDTPRERLERVNRELSKLVERGAIGAVVEATYPLDHFQEALRHPEKNGALARSVHLEWRTRDSVHQAGITHLRRQNGVLQS
jgi:hypothetical protein